MSGLLNRSRCLDVRDLRGRNDDGRDGTGGVVRAANKDEVDVPAVDVVLVAQEDRSWGVGAGVSFDEDRRRRDRPCKTRVDGLLGVASLLELRLMMGFLSTAESVLRRGRE